MFTFSYALVLAICKLYTNKGMECRSEVVYALIFTEKLSSVDASDTELVCASTFKQQVLAMCKRAQMIG
jgi:hypothetical protein